VRIFAFEFFSGGGLAGQPLPPAIAHEGDMMLGALVSDLVGIPDVQVVAGRDPRLPSISGCQALIPFPGEDVFAFYARGLELAHAAWPTAPETGGLLERLARDTGAAGKTLLGSSLDAVRLTASKGSTAKVLRDAGIAVVPTFCRDEPIPCLPGCWVIKPDDGAGCVDSILLPDWAAARGHLAGAPDDVIAQPWIHGEALSLSLLCQGGTARLLSCNRQRVAIEDARLTLQGVKVNACPDLDGSFADLASNIAAAISGLWGYVGVDFILTPHGPVVLEVNPRLTTSYCGLRKALGINTAAMVLAQLDPGSVWMQGSPMPTAGSAVEITLEESDAA
jgi:tyramine---L-glutamate ligase